jgi:peptidoglycan/xylan/chitin deacetylase (PgdA/CDA1 family)
MRHSMRGILRVAVALAGSFGLLLLLLGMGFADSSPSSPQRSIVVTVDDLPVVPATLDIGTQEKLTHALVSAIQRSGAPAIAFVNETKLYVDGVLDPRRVNLLNIWLDAGFELGNHTFNHPSLHEVGPEAFEESIIKGEQVIRPLLAKRGLTLRYFRHPYLMTGRDLATRQRIESFLAAHGYRIAPVTVDNADWIFARAYQDALDHHDQALVDRIGTEYVAYQDRKVDYWERESRDLFGREIPQILLMHASQMNADRYAALAAVLVRRGYRFVTLDEALRDPAWKEPDAFFGRGGISWLHRWALTRKQKPLADEPATPDWVMKLAGVTSE